MYGIIGAPPPNRRQTLRTLLCMEGLLPRSPLPKELSCTEQPMQEAICYGDNTLAFIPSLSLQAWKHYVDQIFLVAVL